MLRCFASQHRSFFSCLYLYVSAPTHSHTQMITTTQPTSHALTHCFATSPPSPFPMSRTYNHIPCSVFLPHYPSRTHILASLSSPPPHTLTLPSLPFTPLKHVQEIKDMRSKRLIPPSIGGISPGHGPDSAAMEHFKTAYESQIHALRNDIELLQQVD